MSNVFDLTDVVEAQTDMGNVTEFYGNLEEYHDDISDIYISTDYLISREWVMGRDKFSTRELSEKCKLTYGRSALLCSLMVEARIISMYLGVDDCAYYKVIVRQDPQYDVNNRDVVEPVTQPSVTDKDMSDAARVAVEYLGAAMKAFAKDPGMFYDEIGVDMVAVKRAFDEHFEDVRLPMMILRGFAEKLGFENE